MLSHQCRFVDRLLESSLDYPHVLYCIDNETHVPAEWARFWAAYIRQAARQSGRHVEVGEMFWQKDLRHPQHRAVYRNPELFGFWEISQNNLLKAEGVWSDLEEGEAHWDRLRFATGVISPVRPVTNVKIYGNESKSDFGSNSHAVERFWRNMIGGAASARFHRPPHGLGLCERAQATIRSARMLADAVNLFGFSPDAVALVDRDPACSFATGSAGWYVVYFSRAGSATIRNAAPAEHGCRWLNSDESRWTDDQAITGPDLLITTPSDDHWIAVVEPKVVPSR